LTVINFVNVEDYVKGLLPYEMGSGFPLEALKAQAVCARTYATAKLGTHGANGFDVCATDHCQVYRGANSATELTDRATEETKGVYITYDGVLCETYYSSSDGGATEDIENVWSSKVPYLRGVADPYEAAVSNLISGYNWSVSYTPSQLASRLSARGYSIGTISSVVVSKFTDVGNVYSVTVKDTSGKTLTFSKGDNLRSIFGVNSIRFTIGGNMAPGTPGTPAPTPTLPGDTPNSGSDGLYANGSGGAAILPSGELYAVGASGDAVLLPSGTFYAITGSGSIEAIDPAAVQSAPTETPSPTETATPEPTIAQTNTGGGGSPSGLVDGKFTFTGTGRGHNVGMSQWGAYSMAKVYGKTYEEILRFYYTDITIEKVG
jgi:stage II sporulation protein D